MSFSGCVIIRWWSVPPYADRPSASFLWRRRLKLHPFTRGGRTEEPEHPGDHVYRSVVRILVVSDHHWWSRDCDFFCSSASPEEAKHRKTRQGKTALFLAVEEGLLDNARSLLDHGSGADALDDEEDSPLVVGQKSPRVILTSEWHAENWIWRKQIFNYKIYCYVFKMCLICYIH